MIGEFLLFKIHWGLSESKEKTSHVTCHAMHAFYAYVSNPQHYCNFRWLYRLNLPTR